MTNKTNASRSPWEGGALETLRTSLLDASDHQWKFSRSKFFQHWFRGHGNAIVFVFKKNLSVTNIQIAELISLVQHHSKLPDGEKQILQFHSVSNFYEFLDRISVSFPSSSDLDQATKIEVANQNKNHEEKEKKPKTRFDFFDNFSKRYWPVFKDSAIAEVYFGCCAIYLPPHLKLDLVRVCGEAGYVFACGPLLYLRKFAKATKRELFYSLDSYLSGNTQVAALGNPSEKPLFLTYCNEDFKERKDDRDPEEDHNTQDFLEKGIGDLKIHLDKVFMEGDSLVTVLDELEQKYEDRLVFSTDTANEGRESSLWLFADKGVSYISEVGEQFRLQAIQDRHRYYVLYEQKYANANPFHIFDENKPAWVAQITIPHKLIAAAINVTKPWPEGIVRLADPFAGTATALFEGLNHKGLETTCSDLDTILEVAHGDNRKFFSLHKEALSKLHEELEQACDTARKTMCSQSPPAENKLTQALEKLKIIHQQSKSKTGEDPLSFDLSKIKADLEQLSDSERLSFYVAVRTLLRYGRAIRWGTYKIGPAFDKSKDELLGQIIVLRDSKAQCEKSSENLEANVPLATHGAIGSLVTFRGKYSFRVTLAQSSLDKLAKPGSLEARFEAGKNAVDLQPNSFDIIVTDPPYGFNTIEETETLADLYGEVIPVLVRGLRENGKLVVCLPAMSYIGRQLPYCTLPGLVTAQILSAAHEAKRQVVAPASSLPSPRGFFSPPYYWHSERALTRVILVFQFH